jgi:hypothetical protein
MPTQYVCLCLKVMGSQNSVSLRGPNDNCYAFSVLSVTNAIIREYDAVYSGRGFLTFRRNVLPPF